MEGASVDLRKCRFGDTLISSLGAELKYIKPSEDKDFYDHIVKYIKIPGQKIGRNAMGNRTHSGHVFRNNRNPERDQDIIKVIKKN